MFLYVGYYVADGTKKHAPRDHLLLFWGRKLSPMEEYKIFQQMTPGPAADPVFVNSGGVSSYKKGNHSGHNTLRDRECI